MIPAFVGLWSCCCSVVSFVWQLATWPGQPPTCSRYASPGEKLPMIIFTELTQLRLEPVPGATALKGAKVPQRWVESPVYVNANHIMTMTTILIEGREVNQILLHSGSDDEDLWVNETPIEVSMEINRTAYTQALAIGVEAART